MSDQLMLSDEVAQALAGGLPVVALESTLLAHGLPPGHNLRVAERLESSVRAAGAVPATIAVLDGRIRVGLSRDELERVCHPDAGLLKLSYRDLAPALALSWNGATTVASTAAISQLAGIALFATGGIGGVHREASTTWDVSADLAVLARTSVLVVSSGVKSVLDIAATLERLETDSVPVLAYRTDQFPAFYQRESEFPAPWRVETAGEAAAVFDLHRRRLGARSGVLLANPIPAEHEMDRRLHERLLTEGLAELRRRGVTGKDVTPVLLEHFHNASGGASLAANEELVVSNATLAAQCAIALAGR